MPLTLGLGPGRGSVGSGSKNYRPVADMVDGRD